MSWTALLLASARIVFAQAAVDRDRSCGSNWSAGLERPAPCRPVPGRPTTGQNRAPPSVQYIGHLVCVGILDTAAPATAANHLAAIMAQLEIGVATA